MTKLNIHNTNYYYNLKNEVIINCIVKNIKMLHIVTIVIHSVFHSSKLVLSYDGSISTSSSLSEVFPLRDAKTEVLDDREL